MEEVPVGAVVEEVPVGAVVEDIPKSKKFALDRGAI